MSRVGVDRILLKLIFEVTLVDINLFGKYLQTYWCEVCAVACADMCQPEPDYPGQGAKNLPARGSHTETNQWKFYWFKILLMKSKNVIVRKYFII